MHPLFTSHHYPLGQVMWICLGLTIVMTEVFASDDLPSVNYIGASYHILRGNPRPTQPGGDSGWTGQDCITFTYTNGTYLDNFRVPDGTTAHTTLTCSYESQSDDVHGMTSYTQQLTVSATETLNGPLGPVLGKFSSSQAYHAMEKTTTEEHSTVVTAEASCTTYSIRIQDPMRKAPGAYPQLSDSFQQAITHLHDGLTTVEGFVDLWGTHMSTWVLMGARFSMSSTFSHEKYYNLQQSGFRFDLGASFSFKLFAGAIHGLSDGDKELAQEYERSRQSLSYSTIGSAPSTDGKWETWANSVGPRPLPTRYELMPLSVVMTRANFPNLRNIDGVRNAVEQYVETLCKLLPGAICTPSPDPHAVPVHFTSVINSGQMEVHSSCPQGSSVLSAGLANRMNAGSATMHPAYFTTGSTGICFDPHYSECHALCASSVRTTSVWSPFTKGIVTTSCPTGYVVSNCGYCSQCGKSPSTTSEMYPFAHPISSSSCIAYDFFGLQGQVSCVAVDDLVPGSYIFQNSAYGTSEFRVGCPSHTQLLGCGYKADNSKQGETYWSIYPDFSTNSCVAYNYFGATAWAICAQFKPHVLVSQWVSNSTSSRQKPREESPVPTKMLEEESPSFRSAEHRHRRTIRSGRNVRMNATKIDTPLPSAHSLP